MPLRIALLLLAAIGLLIATATAAEPEPPEPSAHERLWTSVAELLRRREYGTAANLLEFSADDPELSDDAAQLASDRDLVLSLQSLEALVEAETRKLPEGATLQVGGTEYRILRVDDTDDGLALVGTAADSPNEKTLPLRKLPAETWLKLVEGPLESLARRELVVGVFLAFDRFADAKAARARLDEAARDGEDVRLWLARLEAAEEARRERRGAAIDDDEEDDDSDDLLLGRWRIVIGKGRGERVFNAEFLAGGKARGGGSWEKDAAGRYRITTPNGGVARVRLSGNVLWGEMTNGRRIRGTRQTGT